LFIVPTSSFLLCLCGEFGCSLTPDPYFMRSWEMEDLLLGSAKKLAEAIRTKKVSAVEVTRAYLQRIEKYNPQVNAVVQIAPDVIEQAQAADQALAKGEVRGVLHGVPMTVKDSLETAGIISTSGTLGRKSFVPKQDATCVARLKAAGAIVLGKTNLPELLMGLESDNLVYGRTNNPYDLARTCGGSSGGEGAAQAMGASAIGLGSDSGGSIRLPAHFNGVTSIKPTSGRTARTGQFPPYGGITERLSQVGVMSRWVEDLVLGLPLISGMDWRDQSTVPMPLGDPANVQLKGLRVAFYTAFGASVPTAETAATVHNAVKSVQEAGAVVEEALPPNVEQSVDLLHALFNPDGGARVKGALAQLGTTESSPLLTGFLNIRPNPLTTNELLAVMSGWDMFRNSVLAWLENYDVIICPVCTEPAMPHGEALTKLDAFSYMQTFNLTGYPAVVVRGGTSPEGLPIGVQVVARPWREEVALAVAAHLETALGGYIAPSL
jgi:amidase